VVTREIKRQNSFVII